MYVDQEGRTSIPCKSQLPCQLSKRSHATSADDASTASMQEQRFSTCVYIVGMYVLMHICVLVCMHVCLQVCMQVDVHVCVQVGRQAGRQAGR